MTYRIQARGTREQRNAENRNRSTQNSHEDRLITAIRSHGDPSEALLVATAVIVEYLRGTPVRTN